MKKKLALFLALVLLLSGCARVPQTVPTEPVETLPPVTVPPDTPYPQFPNYDYRNTVEVLTDGAVGVYPLEGEGYYALAPMGESILLFSGEGDTVLTALSESGIKTVTLPGLTLMPGDGDVQVTDRGLGYYDGKNHSIVFLDTLLQETTRISLPKDMTGDPVLSADWANVYYFTDHSLRCLELNSGISRLLKECAFVTQQVRALHFADSVLECAVVDGDVDQTLFVSTQTGEMLFMDSEYPDLVTGQETYFAQWFDGFALRNIFGSRGGEARYLVPAGEYVGLYPQSQGQKVVAVLTDDTGSTLDCYDLQSGKRTASVRMAGVYMPLSVVEDPDRGLLWFLSGDTVSETNVLCCWDPALSALEDEQNYIQPHFTDENPDTDGLERCEKKAQELAAAYRIRIRIWEDAVKVTPEDYTFGAETRVAAYEHYLSILEKALAAYPEGLFKTLGKKSDNKYLTVSLVRSAWGNTELGSLEQAAGVHFWHDGSSYLTLVMDDNFERTFHHELFHAMDSYILTETLAYDFWNDLNPKGFKYDLSYIANQSREDWQYLEEGTRSFIDMYSMSFPKEDRARIMEYAITEGNEEFFASKTMQKKLRTLCDGIREAFRLKDEAYLWEQYLN